MPFVPGQLVVDVNNPGKGYGRLTGRFRKLTDKTFWEVAFGPNERVFIAEEYGQPVGDQDDSIESLIRRGNYGRVDDLRRLLTFEKLKGTLHDFFYSMDAAKIEFLEYQFKPVLAFINSPTERLLLADEVGLGKTIEAALIWLELQARRNARRLLVVCPKMLAHKWRLELREKFGIPAEIGGADQLHQAVADVRRGGEATAFAWVCTYSGLRPLREDLAGLDDPEAGNLSERGRLCRVFKHWDYEFPLFDLAIFDEAHYMRNPGTTTYQLGLAIANAANALLLVSATPVHNKSTDLFTLLRLLDPEFFSTEWVFDNLLEENRPAIQASVALARADFPKAIDALTRLQKSPFVGDSKLLRHAIDQLRDLKPGDHGRRIELQETVEKLNIMSRYLVRTRRAQVKERQPVRSPLILPIEFSEQEMRFYRLVTQMVRHRVQKAGGGFSTFHLILPQQRTASCIPAMVEALRNGELGDPWELLYEAFGPFGREWDIEEVVEVDPVDRDFLELVRDYDFEGHDSKFAALRRLLLGEFREEKVIIFAYFRATLRYLQRRLQAEGIRCALIHGDLTDEERAAELVAFRDDPSVRVLLSSEVGSEGIDLQFCRVVVNYDLPWNPMRVEQRIGRIDRIGQKAEKLTIVHFKVRGTIEERIYDKLHSKLRVFEESIGELEPILGTEIQHLTMELLSRELTPDEEEKVIEQTLLAIETKRRMVAKLEVEQENLFAHSDFIAAQVNRHRSLGRYITAHELKNYISDFFNRNYKGCRLQWDWPEEGCFTLELTHEAFNNFQDYIRRERLHQPPELLTRKIVGTLIPDVAQGARGLTRGRSILLVTHQSPLVRWLTAENFRKEGVFFPLSAVRLRSTRWPPGIYAYRVERWKFTGLKKREYLMYGVARLQESVLLEPDEAERFFQNVIEEGETWHEPNVNHETVLAIFDLIDRDLTRRFELAYKQYVAENDDTLAIYQAQVNSHFQRRLEANQQRIRTMQERGREHRMIALVQANIEKDRLRHEEKLRSLNERARPGSEFSKVASGLVEVRL